MRKRQPDNVEGSEYGAMEEALQAAGRKQPRSSLGSGDQELGG